MNDPIYNQMKEKFDTGEITEEEWKEYCIDKLKELMNEEKEILLSRLK